MESSVAKIVYYSFIIFIIDSHKWIMIYFKLMSILNTAQLFFTESFYSYLFS